MKKIKYILLILISVFFIEIVNAEDIKEITMNIYIDKEGVAHVDEDWKVSFASDEDVTELYKPYGNIGESEFKNFKASLNSKEYKYIENWDINKNFEYKKYKNGINYTDENGVELCWGISEKKTNNNYKITYDITNFVAKTSDSDMVYWTLIPKKMGDSPDKIYIKIYSDFKYEDTLDVWGFGNLGGYAYVYNGFIEMQPKKGHSLESDEHMTILIKFPKDTFKNDNILDEDFNYYLNMAKEGSTSYNDEEPMSDFVGYLILAIIVGIIYFSSKFKYKNKITGNYRIIFEKNHKKLPKEINYFRDIPSDKDLYKAFFISKAYKFNKKDTDFLGAMLLKWLNENKIEIKKEQNNGIFKKEKSSIIFKNDVTFNEHVEESLYKKFLRASKDGVLEANEFKTWASNNYEQIFSWFKKALDNATDKYCSSNILNFIGNNRVKTTDAFYEESIKLKGLKNFLLDFSRMNEKNPIEVKLWNEYLMFAQIFGIADQVIKNFKDMYPDVITDTMVEDISFVTYVSYSGINSASSAKSRAESYSSGGGGFSSGGGGGGSFGGGSFGGGAR